MTTQYGFFIDSSRCTGCKTCELACKDFKDPSSCSRFVRAAFLLQASRKGEGVAHLFHILAAAAVVRGSILTPAGEEEYTRYSCVIDPKEGAYYYKTYDGLQIARVSMDETAREGTQLREFLPWQE